MNHLSKIFIYIFLATLVSACSQNSIQEEVIVQTLNAAKIEIGYKKSNPIFFKSMPSKANIEHGKIPFVPGDFLLNIIIEDTTVWSPSINLDDIVVHNQIDLGENEFWCGSTQEGVVTTQIGPISHMPNNGSPEEIAQLSSEEFNLVLNSREEICLIHATSDSVKPQCFSITNQKICVVHDGGEYLVYLI